MWFTFGYIALFILFCFLLAKSLWFFWLGVALYFYVGHKKHVAERRRRDAFQRAQEEEDQRRQAERWRNMTDEERQTERWLNESAKEFQRKLDERAEKERQTQRRLNERAEEILREQDETKPTSCKATSREGTTMRPVTLEDFPGWFFMGEGEVGHDCSRNVFRVTKIHSLEEGIRCCDKCEEPIPEAVQTLAILNQP